VHISGSVAVHISGSVAVHIEGRVCMQAGEARRARVASMLARVQGEERRAAEARARKARSERAKAPDPPDVAPPSGKPTHTARDRDLPRRAVCQIILHMVFTPIE
jgi:hypothetical protein